MKTQFQKRQRWIAAAGVSVALIGCGQNVGSQPITNAPVTTAEPVAETSPAAAPQSTTTPPANATKPAEHAKTAASAPPREVATAAETNRALDLMKLPRINQTKVWDENATYVYYTGKASIASADGFYRAELGSRGWKEFPSKLPASPQYPDRLYEKDGFLLRVSISGSEENVAGVMLSSFGNADMRTLPCADDTQMQDTSTPANANFQSTRSMAELAKFSREKFAALGWREYHDFNAPVEGPPHVVEIRFVKNASRVLVLILRNLQRPSDKVIVSYMAESALPYDLPMLADGTNLRLDTYSAKAEYTSPTDVATAAAFYQAVDKKLGWKLRQDSKPVSAASALLFVEDGPEVGFGISIAKHEGATKVTFNRLSFKEPPQVAASEPAEEPTTESKPKSEKPSAADVAANELQNEVQAAIAAEMKKAKGELEKAGLGNLNLEGLLKGKLPLGDDAPANEPADSAAEKVTRQKLAPEIKAAKLPIACTVTHGDKTVELKHAVAFEAQMFDSIYPRIIFSDKPIAMPKLTKALARGKEISMFDLLHDDGGPTIGMQITLQEGAVGMTCFLDGASINITSSDITSDALNDGQRLRGKIALPKSQDEKVFDKLFHFEATFDGELLKLSDKPAAAEGELAASDEHELLVPEGCSSYAQEGTKYRKQLTTAHAADVSKLAGFYRREMPAKEMKEDAAKSKVTAKDAMLVYSGPEGRTEVSLRREGDETQIVVTSINEAAAKKDDLVPKPGQALLMLGNATDGAITIVVDGKEHKLAKGVGAENPADAMRIELKPGKHKVVIKVPSAPDETHDLDIQAGTTWGAVAFPGGGGFASQVF